MAIVETVWMRKESCRVKVNKADADLWSKNGFELDEAPAAPDPAKMNKAQLAALAKSKGIAVPGNASKDDILALVTA